MRKDRLTFGSKTLAAGVLGGMIAAAPVAAALAGVPAIGPSAATTLEAPVTQVHWHHCCWHHHHHHIFTRLVDAGSVSYPVYRIEHYKIDFAHPTFAPIEPVGWWLW
jgi:hypothetical protein